MLRSWLLASAVALSAAATARPAEGLPPIKVGAETLLLVYTKGTPDGKVEVCARTVETK
jgi:hypothetical protein